MKEFKAIVAEHYDFVSKGKDKKNIKTTKLYVNINNFLIIDVNTELANDLDLFTECVVTLDSKDGYRKDGKPNYKVVTLNVVK